MMRWVHVEAAQELTEIAWPRHTQIALRHDKRESRLLVRYNDCSNKIHANRGFMSQIKDAGGQARELVNAAKCITTQQKQKAIVYTDNMG